MADSDTKALEEEGAPKQASNPQLDLDAESLEEDKPQEDGKSENASKEEEDDDDEEVGECGFCLYMKAGGCKDSFTAWEQCVEESEKNKEDIAEKCFEITTALKKCMEAHADYYEPILRAEKVAEAEAVKVLEKEKAAESSDDQNASASENLEHHSG